MVESRFHDFTPITDFEILRHNMKDYSTVVQHDKLTQKLDSLIKSSQALANSNEVHNEMSKIRMEIESRVSDKVK